MKIRQKFQIVSIVLILLSVLQIASWFWYEQANENVRLALDNQQVSYLLADQLRQSSDDLTRLARTYVVTGNPKYETQYLDVLAIRNGEKPVPQDYHRIYWDFMAHTGVKPRPDGEKISLEQMMKNAGFTETEFAKLRQAQANSDGLVDLEVVAMNAVKGKFRPENSKDFTIEKSPDLAFAQKLMFSPEYHQYKAEIMRPVDDFYELLETRIEQEIATARSEAYMAQIGVGITLSLLILSAISALFLTARGVLAPLGQLRTCMGDLQDGKLDVVVPELDRQDEIGMMARATDMFRLGLAENESLREDQKQQASAAEATRQQTLNHLADMVQQTVFEISHKIEDSANHLGQNAQNLSKSAEGTREHSHEVALAAGHASENVQNVASAIEELAASITEVSQKAQHSITISSQAMTSATRSSATVEKLQGATDKIGEVITLINDIADQTNLLALNATIEAARAGDAGKGFAVVAAEVKSLANQTGGATQEIQGQILAIQQETQQAVTEIGEISDIISKIDRYLTDISTAMSQQEATSHQISRNVEETAKGSNQVADTIDAVRTDANATGQAAQNVAQASNALLDDVRQLQGKVQEALSEIRAQ